MSALSKAQLTAALVAAGVKIPRKANLATLTELHNTQMLAELNAALPAAEEARIAQLDLQAAGEAVAAEILTLGEFGLGDSEANATCPHCGINHKDNGWQLADGYPGAKHEYICLACGGEWGPLVVAPVAQATGTGLKIEKVRPEQNGVKRPSIGGKCRAIWDALDAYRTETGELPTSKVVKALAADEGWNPNNASIEYYQWRKFNGIAKGQ